ncbi:hypothetical protein M514_16426 [Trichuris suis]|uniref:Uncharacterized protein n=1 Tax=Trichuris suis TaxID=68888 RepID=A0A085NPU8_9BILA|nr:hypothetical protein M514_16426 [Trichuris suis]
MMMPFIMADSDSWSSVHFLQLCVFAIAANNQFVYFNCIGEFLGSEDLAVIKQSLQDYIVNFLGAP